jgi:hypothetical protein
MKLSVKFNKTEKIEKNTKIEKAEYAATALALYAAAGILVQVGDACIDLLFGITEDKK